jgi:NMD protein affecting ribosome stability and mRNA decay
MLGRRLLQVAIVLFALQAYAQGPQRPAQKPVTRNPHGPLNIACENCHTTLSWKPIRSIPEFNHDSTRYPLRGMHEKVQCIQCHVKLVFTDVGQKCSDCHADIHRGQFGANCESCHTVKGWKVSVQAIRDHQNRFPLIGAHAAVDCESCHKGAATGQFQGLSTQCYSCHAKEFQTTANPNHVTARFSTNCEQCHGTNTWLDAKFDHATTGFPLTNAHADPPRMCADCHINNNYNLTTTACISCHLANYQAAKNPNHIAGGFSQTCQQCHTTSAWQPATFDHNSVGFPLTNAHADPPRMCADCHINNNYSLTTTTCVSCHLANYQGAKSPDHVAGGFSQTCQQCHTTSAWQPATFDHTTVGFPLTNAHADPPRVCLDCHINNNYNLTTTACVSCHLANFQGAKNPDHVAGGFSQTCQQCHTTSAWQPAAFDHTTVGFPLTNAHAEPPRVCLDCHINNNYNLTTTACASCHLKDYNAATTPINHVQLGFPTACESCHDTVLWTHGKFDHSATGFPLTNSHTVPPRVCADCHINNNYNLTSANTTCVSCHLSAYNTATTPINHIQVGFPTTCQLCHDMIAWTDGKFDHNTTTFPLTGFHANPPPLMTCAMCHVNNNYTTLPTTCYGCHVADYNGTTNPIHKAAPTVFTTTCTTCHTTASWLGATFNHTWFPENHGNANSVCATCHTNSSDYTIFQCTGCHGGGNPNNFHHPNVGGYVYNSVNCYQCHKH